MIKKLAIAIVAFGALSLLLNVYSAHTKPPGQRLTELQQARDQIVKRR
jgi:hypothetical protein